MAQREFFYPYGVNLEANPTLYWKPASSHPTYLRPIDTDGTFTAARHTDEGPPQFAGKVLASTLDATSLEREIGQNRT